ATPLEAAEMPTTAPAPSIAVPLADAATPTPAPDKQLADNNDGQPGNVFDNPNKSKDGDDKVVATADSVSTLAPIKEKHINYDETAKLDTSPQPALGASNLGGSTTTSIATKGSVEEALNSIAAV